MQWNSESDFQPPRSSTLDTQEKVRSESPIFALVTLSVRWYIVPATTCNMKRFTMGVNGCLWYRYAERQVVYSAGNYLKYEVFTMGVNGQAP